MSNTAGFKHADGTTVKPLRLIECLSTGIWKLIVTLTGEVLAEGYLPVDQRTAECAAREYADRPLCTGGYMGYRLDDPITEESVAAVVDRLVARGIRPWPQGYFMSRVGSDRIEELFEVDKKHKLPSISWTEKHMNVSVGRVVFVVVTDDDEPTDVIIYGRPPVGHPEI